MPTTDQPGHQQLQRLLDRRQRTADDATAALAHRSHRAHRLFRLLAELEDQLEGEHPRTVAALLGDWATHDADQLARHQQQAATGCQRCEADRARTAESVPQALTA